LKADWNLIHKNPPKIIKQEDHDQLFQNFDGDVPMEVDYYDKVLITTVDDYTQTQGFNVSVNANIPVSAVIVFQTVFMLIHVSPSESWDEAAFW
jgi:hypothetical protein